MTGRNEIIGFLAADFAGLDLRRSSLSRSRNAATVAQNVELEKTGKLTVRKGCHQALRMTDDLLIPHTYVYFDSTSGATKQELIGLAGFRSGSPSIVKIQRITLDVQYTGSGDAEIDFFPEDDNGARWRLTIRVDGETVYTNTYGEAHAANPSTISDLKDDIDALGDFAASFSATGPADSHASVIGPFAEVEMDESFPLFVDTDVLANPAPPTIYPGGPGVVFTPPTFLNHANVALFACGDYLWTYDGLRQYRAGLPQATLNGLAETGSGSTFANGESYIYKLVYKRVDFRGNIIHGEDSDDTLAVASIAVTSSTDITLTIDTLSSANSLEAFGARSAQVNGAQSGVRTITVDNGHDLETGDVVYFYDGVSSTYVRRTLTGTTSTSLSFGNSEDAVNVADNAIISNNVRIEIWRTKNGGTDFYLVDEIPNDSANATQTYVDQTTDANIGAAFVEQVRKYSLPPRCRYLTQHQGLVVAAGDPDNPNTIYWSLPDAFTAFPAASNSLDIKDTTRGPITGIISDTDNMLAVFKELSYINVVGDLDSLALQVVNKTSGDIGCTSHATLQKVGDRILGLSRLGPFTLRGGEISAEIGRPIFSQFQNQEYEQVDGETISSQNERKLVLQRATAINDYRNERYILFVPAETGIPGAGRYQNEFSKWYVLDYSFGFERAPNWRTFQHAQHHNAGYGFTIYEDDLYWAGSFVGTGGVIETALLKELRTGTKYDYADDCSPIWLEVRYQWIVAESPSSFFKWLRTKVFRFDPGLEESFTLYVEELRNYDDETLYTETSRVFASTDREKIIKMASGKARAFQLIIGAVALHAKAEWDGIECELSIPFERRMKDTKGG